MEDLSLNYTYISRIPVPEPKEFPKPTDASLAIGQSAPWLWPYHYFGSRGLPETRVPSSRGKGKTKQTQKMWRFHRLIIRNTCRHPKLFHDFFGGLGYLGMTFGEIFPSLIRCRSTCRSSATWNSYVHHLSVKAPSFGSTVEHLMYMTSVHSSCAKPFFFRNLNLPTFHSTFTGGVIFVVWQKKTTQTMHDQPQPPKTSRDSTPPLLGIGRLCFSLHRWIFKSLDGKEGGQNTCSAGDGVKRWPCASTKCVV